MTSAVTSRPTHYATLGLEPGATEDQIQRAFAREMSAIRPRAFGGIAEVSIAYEVLRDPVRRKAYDESIGIAPKPKAPAKVQWQASPYLLRASARPSPPPEIVPQPRQDPPPLRRSGGGMRSVDHLLRPDERIRLVSRKRWTIDALNGHGRLTAQRFVRVSAVCTAGETTT